MTDNCQVVFQEYLAENGLRIGRATLSAPSSLNALTLEMIEALYQRLIEWQQASQVVAVVLDGDGGRAFCAGGDIRKLQASVLESNYGHNPYGERFFSREYRLDYLIHTFNKPVLCWGAGIVMGGGIGLMAGASHRVVTPSSKLAMPEVSIGLFPDVGGSWILNCMPGQAGLFLGVTGARLNAGDALFCGLADRLLEDQALPDVIDQIQKQPWMQPDAEGSVHNGRLMTQLLRRIEYEQAVNSPVSMVKEHFDEIQHVTDVDEPEEMLLRLKEKSGEWWGKATSGLAQGCPVTAALVFEQLKRGKHLSLADVFRMELNMAVQCLREANLQKV